CGYGDLGKNATCPFEVTVRKAGDANGNPVMGPDGQPAVVTVPITESQYNAFTAIAARQLDADAVTLCWSGKGVYLNYKEQLVDVDKAVTVPDLWEHRTVGNDNVGFPWDFTKENPAEQPQVVVITLGTNDFTRDTKEQHGPGQLPGDNVPDGTLLNPAEYDRFFQKYLEFVRKVRDHRRDAHIFLATSPMMTDQYPFTKPKTMLRR